MHLPSLLLLALSAAPQAAPAARPDAGVRAAAPDAEDVVAATERWRAQRLARLTSEDGWLTVVGLTWVAEGSARVGSAPDAQVRLPADAPAQVGVLHVEFGKARFVPAPGVAVTLGGKPFAGGTVRHDQEEGGPDVLQVGSVRFHTIERQGRMGVRVKDSEAPARKAFKGVPAYPADARWRVEGRWEELVPPRTMRIPNVLGSFEDMKAPGVVVFQRDGKEYRLTPVLEPGTDKLFFIFADATNRDTTYNLGRFLSADLPKDGKVVLDFNLAYSPPCAFTRFATCPLPPRNNKLALRVEAGEKRLPGGAH